MYANYQHFGARTPSINLCHRYNVGYNHDAVVIVFMTVGLNGLTTTVFTAIRAVKQVDIKLHIFTLVTGHKPGKAWTY